MANIPDTCEKCDTQGVKVVYYLHLGKWSCSKCYEPDKCPSQGSLHIMVRLNKRQVSLARIKAMKERRISRDDFRTVVNNRGQSVTQRGYGYA